MVMQLTPLSPLSLWWCKCHGIKLDEDKDEASVGCHDCVMVIGDTYATWLGFLWRGWQQVRLHGWGVSLILVLLVRALKWARGRIKSLRLSHCNQIVEDIIALALYRGSLYMLGGRVRQQYHPNSRKIRRGDACGIQLSSNIHLGEVPSDCPDAHGASYCSLKRGDIDKLLVRRQKHEQL